MTPQEYVENYDRQFSNEKAKEKVVAYNKALVKRYPFLKPYNEYTGKEDESYTSTWLDDMPRGWRIAFAEKMCEELLPILEKVNYVNEYKILQVKEKYASLRWYYGDVPEEISEEIAKVISKYEDISYNTCCNCGKPATYESKGWICPFCKDCARSDVETEEQFKHMFVKKRDA